MPHIETVYRQFYPQFSFRICGIVTDLWQGRNYKETCDFHFNVFNYCGGDNVDDANLLISYEITGILYE